VSRNIRKETGKTFEGQQVSRGWIMLDFLGHSIQFTFYSSWTGKPVEHLIYIVLRSLAAWELCQRVNLFGVPIKV
jgi:hypothetical protein